MVGREGEGTGKSNVSKHKQTKKTKTIRRRVVGREGEDTDKSDVSTNTKNKDKDKKQEGSGEGSGEGRRRHWQKQCKQTNKKQ